MSAKPNFPTLRSLCGGVIAFLLAVPLCGHAISRWGNGKMASAEIGFMATLPEAVIQTRPMTSKKLALEFGGMMAASMSMPFPAPSNMMVGELAEEYPEYQGKTAAEIKSILQGLNPKWTELRTVKGAMTLALRGETATTVLVIWAPDKGVVLTGPRTATVDDSIQKILRSTRIQGIP
jgi:hypothetical protein